MKIEHENGWIKIKRIGGVKFVPAPAAVCEREGCDIGYIEFSGLDGEDMGRASDAFESVADWIADVLTEQIPYPDLTEKEDRRERRAFVCALIRWELLPDLQVALQRIGHPWAYQVPPRGTMSMEARWQSPGPSKLLQPAPSAR